MIKIKQSELLNYFMKLSSKQKPQLSQSFEQTFPTSPKSLRLPVNHNNFIKISDSKKSSLNSPRSIKTLYSHQIKKLSISSDMMQTPQLNNQSPEKLTLQQKIIESQLRNSNQQYQHLLIEQKQMELQYIQLQGKEKAYMNQLKKQQKVIEEHKIQLKRVQKNLQKKKQYLEQYYNYLDQKLGQNGLIPKSLYSKFIKLQEVLNQRYLDEQSNVEKNIQERKKELHNASLQTQRLKYLRNQLIRELQFNSNSGQSQASIANMVVDRKKQKIDEFNELLQKINFEKEKEKNLKNQNSMLIKIKQIEEQHKRHTMIIESGIKRVFKYKLRSILMDKKHKQEAHSKLPELAILLSEKSKQKRSIQEEIQTRRGISNDLKTTYNQLLDQLSYLQHQNRVQSNYKQK